MILKINIHIDVYACKKKPCYLSMSYQKMRVGALLVQLTSVFDGWRCPPQSLFSFHTTFDKKTSETLSISITMLKKASVYVSRESSEKIQFQLLYTAPVPPTGLQLQKNKKLISMPSMYKPPSLWSHRDRSIAKKPEHLFLSMRNDSLRPVCTEPLCNCNQERHEKLFGSLLYFFESLGC